MAEYTKSNHFQKSVAQYTTDVIDRFIADKVQNMFIPQKSKGWRKFIIRKIKFQLHIQTRKHRNLKPQVTQIHCPASHFGTGIPETFGIFLNGTRQFRITHGKAAASHIHTGKTGYRCKFSCSGSIRLSVAEPILHRQRRRKTGRFSIQRHFPCCCANSHASTE